MVRFIGQTWDPDLDSELGIYLPEVKLWKPNAEQEKGLEHWKLQCKE